MQPSSRICSLLPVYQTTVPGLFAAGCPDPFSEGVKCEHLPVSGEALYADLAGYGRGTWIGVVRKPSMEHIS